MRLIRQNEEVFLEESGTKVGVIQAGGIQFTKELFGKIEFDEELNHYLLDQRNKDKENTKQN